MMMMKRLIAIGMGLCILLAATPAEARVRSYRPLGTRALQFWERVLPTYKMHSPYRYKINMSRQSLMRTRIQDRVRQRLNTRSIRRSLNPPRPVSRVPLRDGRVYRRPSRRSLVQYDPPTSKLPVYTEGQSTNEMRDEVLRLTNIERERAGLVLLSRHPLLDFSAQKHAVDMYENNYFSHENPAGEDFRERIRQTGYGNIDARECNCSGYTVSYGENNAKGQFTAEQAVRDWMNSEDHRKNILNPKYDHIGIGLRGDVWVQNFGRIKIER